MAPGFGVRLKEAIRQSGFKQKQLANQLGVTGPLVTQWIKEENPPSLKTFSQLCLILKADPAQLLYGQAKEAEDEMILKAVYRFRPSVRKALIAFLSLI